MINFVLVPSALLITKFSSDANQDTAFLVMLHHTKKSYNVWGNVPMKVTYFVSKFLLESHPGNGQDCIFFEFTLGS